LAIAGGACTHQTILVRKKESPALITKTNLSSGTRTTHDGFFSGDIFSLLGNILRCDDLLDLHSKRSVTAVRNKIG